ncbi:MAG: tetratricopeptide repeat protein, partial [Paludibacteraceae bacterium]|nr:tetratricopeptide repeat protein [Paludibacteraceae bacterium]
LVLEIFQLNTSKEICQPIVHHHQFGRTPFGLIWFLKSHNEKKAEANDAIYKAQSWFERDSFQLALSGNDDFIGFEEVADKYSSTPAGNLACAYAGICYKNLGKNDDAIKYLKKFSADDNLVSPAIYGAIGDCYFESNSIKDAESYYMTAIDSKNNMIAPLYTYRLAMLYFKNGDNAKASDLMVKLKDDYPQSNEARDADKYIEYFQSLKK